MKWPQAGICFEIKLYVRIARIDLDEILRGNKHMGKGKKIVENCSKTLIFAYTSKKRTMTISDLVANASKLDIRAFEQFYQELSLMRAKRKGQKILSGMEADLIEKINQKFPTDKWERLQYLDWKLENGQLTSAEEAESLKLATEYEGYYVERVKSLSELAAIRQVGIDVLVAQFNLNSPASNA